jgi:very-short-patch-repair endonuclease
VTALAAWLEQVAERERPTGSGAEFDLLPHLDAAGLPRPCLQHEVTLLTGVTIHLDIAWPKVKLDVEPGHSAFHSGEAVRRDYQRDNELGRLGWQVMRFDEIQQRAPKWCAMQVAEVYRVRAAHLQVASRAAQA